MSATPQAFPTAIAVSAAGDEYHGLDGMTLRDWFAGQAAAMIFAGPGAQQVADRDSRYDETNWTEIVALNAYELADAMLAERAKGGAA